MKLHRLLYFTFLISFRQLDAQNNLPPAYEIKTDTEVNITLDDAYWQVLKDPSGELSIDQVSQSALAEKFKPNNTQKKGFDYSIKAYWIRYRFRNSMTHDASITIAKRMTYADLYTRSDDGKWNLKRTGRGVPWSKRNDLKRITAISYIIPPGGELLIYEKDNFDHDYDLFGLPAIEFGFTKRVLREQYLESNSYILPSILCGFLLLAALFNIYFFWIIRERVYLFFSFVLLSRAIGGIIQDTDLFLREDPVTKWRLIGIFYFYYFFFWIHFVRYFLKTFEHFPRWDKLLVGLSIYLTLISISNLLHLTRIGEPSYAIIMFIVSFTFLLFIRSGNRSVRWRIVMVLPGMSIFIFPLSDFLFTLLEKYTGKHKPAFLAWQGNNFSTLEPIALVWLLLFFSWNLVQRYQLLQKQIAHETLAKERLAKEREIERNQLIAQQKVDLELQVKERTSQLNQSLNDLKSTQAQLIQSEKMASLGELTAGIAHEIQNPLNFMNNFSEVNKELLVELKDEIDKGNGEEVKSIANNVIANEEKINHHGKRADAIVKGMLQHSRTNSGQKEPVDLNALADEYLRLAYQGLRAKDKSFNTALETNFDQTIGNINVVPQDIGRALLNVYNNAFYAVSEKKKQFPGGLSAGALTNVDYKPGVFVSTRKAGGKIEISVRDNGNGIPQKLMDKIFQPFFTTKPTGQGTGLGLSLSYDIIKAHGGEISVESNPGEGAEIIIKMPNV